MSRTGACAHAPACARNWARRSPSLPIYLALVLLTSASACREAPTPEARPRPTLPGAPSPALPAHVSSLASGMAIFQARCIECHGASGAGDGPAAALLRTPPPDLSDVHYMADQRPDYYAEAVRVGVPGTGMPRWDHVLDEAAVWDAAFYAWSLGARDGALERGGLAYAERCARCHGADGMGVDRATLASNDLAARSRAEVAAAIAARHPEMVGELSDEELADLSERLFGFLYSTPSAR